jgi:hypothetical protein
MDERQIEQESSEKARMTQEIIDAAILEEQYHAFPGTGITVCCLKLRNGYAVTGQSAFANPEDFSLEIKRNVARDKARGQILALEEYAMRRDQPAT